MSDSVGSVGQKYEELLNKAKEEYFSIDYLVCTILGNRIIYFNYDGFRHFIYKNRMGRSKPDQIRRFGLIQYIRSVVVSSKTIFEDSRIISGTRFISLLHNIRDNYSVRMVVRISNDGKIFFVSIMDTNKNSG